MNKNLFLISMLLLCFELSAGNLTNIQEQQVRKIVGTYCNLLSDFSQSREFYSNQDKIVGLFPSQVGDVARFVVDDLKSMQMTDISNYLSMLIAENQYHYSVKLSYLEDINKVPISGLSAPSMEKSDAMQYGVMTLTKQTNGAINKTVKNVFWVNLTSEKIDRILAEKQEDFFTQALKYYNDEPKQYEKAFDCFRKAAEIGNEEAQYRLAIMLLKKQGCNHIPKNVRDAEALFWLQKLCFSNNSYKEKALNVLAVFGVKKEYIYHYSSEKVPYNEGLIRILKGKKVGFANESGKIIIPCMYDEAQPFSEGLSAVRLKSKWGFIDKNNKIIIDFKYSDCESFYKNLAPVELNGKVGYINKTGKTIIPFEYDKGYSFINELAPVKLKDKWGYISSSNKIVIPIVCDDTSGFSESYPENENIKLAIIRLGDTDYKIDFDGEIYYEKDIKETWWSKTNNTTLNDMIIINAVEGVVINGIRWASCNVDKSGTFASSPGSPGKFYQWNSDLAWRTTGSVRFFYSVVRSGTFWERKNDPSPTGWHVPTDAEMSSLLDSTKVSCEWVKLYGVKGRKFTDKGNGNSIFLPAVGYRDHDNYEYSKVFSVNDNGYYWSSTQEESIDVNSYILFFESDRLYRSSLSKSDGLSVRPVAD